MRRTPIMGLSALLSKLGVTADERTSLRGTLLRGGLGSIGLNLSHVLFSFLISIALARILGAESFGIYSFAYALAMVLAIPAQSGMSQLVLRETAQAFAAEDWGRIRGLWTWSTGTVLVLSLVISLLLLGLLGLFQFLLGDAVLRELS